MDILSLEDHWNERVKEFENIPEKGAEVITLVGFVKDLQPKTILEVGCNYGRELKYLEGLGEIYGLDFNRKMIKNAASYISGTFVVGSAISIPYISRAFELVYSDGLASHIPPSSVKNTLKEIIRVSRRYILLIEYLGTRSSRNAISNCKKFTWIHDYDRLISVFDVDTKYNKKISFGTDLFQIILLEKKGEKIGRNGSIKEIPKKKFWGFKIGKFRVGFDR